MKTRFVALSAAALVATATAQQNVCTTQIDGVGCGPQLTVSFAPSGSAGNQTITVDVAGMYPGGIGLMAWGQMPLNVPLFGCTAYTDFMWGHPVNPDANGQWSWSRSWPNSVQGFYRIQVASLGLDTIGNITVHLTDCVVAQCTQ
jgi:hypothetical protein